MLEMRSLECAAQKAFAGHLNTKPLVDVDVDLATHAPAIVKQRFL